MLALRKPGKSILSQSNDQRALVGGHHGVKTPSEKPPLRTESEPVRRRSGFLTGSSGYAR